MKKITMVLSLWLVFFGCATASGPQTASQAPPWALDPPATIGQDALFVGSGVSDTGNVVEAREQAIQRVKELIMDYIGVSVTSVTTGEVQASLDSFQGQIETSLRSESSAQLSGFKVGESIIVESGGLTFVYLQGLFNQRQLEEKRKEFEKKVQENVFAVSGVEAEGDALITQGNPYEAIAKYIQAGAAAINRFDEKATSFEQENQMVAIQRTLNKARDAINALNIVALNPGIETPGGEPFSESFRIKVVRGSGENDPGVPEVPLRVSFKILRSNNRMGVQSERVITDRSGVAQFNHPTPTFTGREDLTVVLDLGSHLRPLEQVGRRFLPQVVALEEAAAKNRATIPYTVVSNAKNIPMAIAVLDLNESGALNNSTSLSSGIMGALTSDGFAVSLVQGNTSVILGQNDAGALNALRALLPSNTKRVILGSGTVVEVNEGAGITVRVSSDIKVLDVSTGAVLYSTNKAVRARGSNKAAAISSAFRQLGQEVGRDMVNKLP